MWLSNIKTTFFTKGIIEGFDIIYEILGMSFSSYKWILSLGELLD